MVEALEQKLRAAGLPLVGVTLGTRTDKATWRVDWSQPPTAQQQATAQAIIDAFDIATEEAKAAEAEGTSRAEIIARGIGRVLVAKGICTANELKAAIKAEWEASK